MDYISVAESNQEILCEMLKSCFELKTERNKTKNQQKRHRQTKCYELELSQMLYFGQSTYGYIVIFLTDKIVYNKGIQKYP